MASEHKPGQMDISEQEKAFHGLIRVLAWGAGVAIAVLIFLAIVNA